MSSKFSPTNRAFPLLSTRLMPPQLPGGTIPRERLLDRLNGDSRRAGFVAIITAPAGYGKSTLLSQSNRRYREAGWNTAWLNLEDNDNDDEEFLRYLAEAISQLVDSMPRSSRRNKNRTPGLTTGPDLIFDLINTVSLTDQRFALFLDDYHVIHEKKIHGLIQNLITHLPDNLNLIVGSRTQLPIPLAKLRASNSLISIEIDDLRFNQDEAVYLFQNTNRLEIEEAQLEQLYQRTGGWPAVMQLAAISFRDANDRAKFIDTFSGSTGPVSDFLAEELIDRLPGDFAAFLIRSAITERLCHPLCKQITGNEEFSSRLRVIGNDRFLIQQLDSEGYWYRFHPLFRNFLLRQMDLRFENEKQELHRRASRWYEDQGMIAEATRHAINGGDETHALALLEEQGMHFINHGHLSLLLSLIRRLPDNFLHGSMEILIQLAWIEVLNNRIQQTRDLLAEIKEILTRQGITDEEEWMKVYALEVPICFFEDDYVEGEKLVDDWLNTAPEFSILFASLSVMSSYINLNKYQYDQSMDAALWLLDPSDQLEFAYSHSFAACAHGLAWYYRGFPRRALSGLGEAMEWLSDHVSNSSQTINILKPLQAACCYQMGELEQASNMIQEGLNSLNALAAPDHFLAAVPVRARLLHTEEGYQRALDYLLETKILAEERNWHRLECAVLHERVRLYIELNSIDQARAIYEQCERKLNSATGDSSPQSLQSREWLRTSEARIAIAELEFDNGRMIIESLLQDFKPDERVMRCMEILILMARLNIEADCRDEARRNLTEALLLDEEHSISQLFRDEGAAVLDLLVEIHTTHEQASKGSRDNVIREKLGRILEPDDLEAGTQWGGLTGSSSTSRSGEYPALIESLTKRELATMEKVVEGYSNKEISDSMYVSINTVKSHIYSSFSKLGVSRRTQAVRRLKELGIFR